MRSTSEQEENCPLHFSYMSYGNWFIVTTNTPSLAHDNLFNWSSSAKRLQEHCLQTQCDHATCAYKQELVRALNSNTIVFNPYRSSKNT